MSMTARRYQTRGTILGSLLRQEFLDEARGAQDCPPYRKEYFKSFSREPLWASRRGSQLEVPFLECEPSLRKDVQDYIGDDDNTPNWSCPEEITIGFAFGATQNNYLIWEGNQYWAINKVILGHLG